MKNRIVVIALAMLMTGGVWSQDTLSQKVAPLSNYFYNEWLDTTERCAYSWLGDGSEAIAKQFVTKDTLRVYGIAAMMTCMERYSYMVDSMFYTPYYSSFQQLLNAKFPEDPSLEQCGESLLLYQYYRNGSPVMQQVGDSLPIHYLHTPVNHWMMPNTPPVLPKDTFPIPLYERYFGEPQTVHDTFFVGYTQHHWGVERYYSEYWEDTCYRLYQKRAAFMCFDFVTIPSMTTGFGEDLANNWYVDSNMNTEWEIQRGWYNSTLYIFPILTPNPDTTGTPTDTTWNPSDTTVNPTDTTGVGIQQVDMVYRYTTVAPNPARERVTVTSSFGLARIEAYDERGTRIHDAKASGYKADLDVSTWPRGAYLLRITTGAGPTVKKLLVQ